MGEMNFKQGPRFLAGVTVQVKEKEQARQDGGAPVYGSGFDGSNDSVFTNTTHIYNWTQ